MIDLINKGYNIKPQGVYREDAGLYFRNVKMQNFGHDVLVELEVILGYELPKSCVLQYEDSLIGENIKLEDQCLSKVLLVVTKKAITRKWCKKDATTCTL